MFTFLLTIYLLTIILCVSSYAFYPMVIWAIGKLFPLRVRKAKITPFVSVIISAYNEGKNIEKKILNTWANKVFKNILH